MGEIYKFFGNRGKFIHFVEMEEIYNFCGNRERICNRPKHHWLSGMKGVRL